jgi:hypothetical protein
MKMGGHFRASLVFALISIIVNLVLIGLPFLLAGKGSGSIIILFGIIGVGYLVNLAIYFLAGYFTGKKEGATAIDGGITACFAFFIALSVTALANAALTIAFYGSFAGRGDPESMGAGLLFAGMMGAFSLVFAAINYVFTLFAGLLVNFIAGATGGYLSSKRI